ncbi:MAG: thioredoxin [Candidatus Krumholzibacteria bacterium]|nr:thioredoxin [Candidatus Krumholzibacteria bacterium]
MHADKKPLTPARQPNYLVWGIIVAVVIMVSAGIYDGIKRLQTRGRPNMTDYSYANMRGTSRATNAKGEVVSLDSFAGRFLWVDYAAPWCGPCASQARVMKSLEATASRNIVFLTMLTSANKPFQTATKATAASWAGRFGLNPALVVTGGNPSYTIPQHKLFSPLGQTLYHKVGFLSEDQIRSTLVKSMREWQHWRQDNQTADILR